MVYITICLTLLSGLISSFSKTTHDIAGDPKSTKSGLLSLGKKPTPLGMVMLLVIITTSIFSLIKTHQDDEKDSAKGKELEEKITILDSDNSRLREQLQTSSLMTARSIIRDGKVEPDGVFHLETDIPQEGVDSTESLDHVVRSVLPVSVLEGAKVEIYAVQGEISNTGLIGLSDEIWEVKAVLSSSKPASWSTYGSFGSGLVDLDNTISATEPDTRKPKRGNTSIDLRSSVRSFNVEPISFLDVPKESRVRAELKIQSSREFKREEIGELVEDLRTHVRKAEIWTLIDSTIGMCTRQPLAMLDPVVSKENSVSNVRVDFSAAPRDFELTSCPKGLFRRDRSILLPGALDEAEAVNKILGKGHVGLHFAGHALQER